MSALLDPFFDQALEVFERVTRASGDGPTCDECVVGQPVRVHYASQALAESLRPAINRSPAASMAAAGEPPCLTVFAWGGEMPGGLLPAPPWEALGFFERGNVRGHQSERYTLVYDRRPEVFSAFDAQRQLGLYWARDSRALPYYERAAPMRRVFQGWLQTRGLLVLHAAGVSAAAGGAAAEGALLAGRTGSGKSTTAAACARAGLGFAGDDYVVVEPGRAPRLHGLYGTLKLNGEMLAWMPELAPLVSNCDRLAIEKALIYWPAPALGEGGAPLRAVLLPRPTAEADTRARPVPPEAGYRAIVPDSLFTLLGQARLVTGAVRELVNTVPCFDLALGTDLRQVAAVIGDLLGAGARRP